MMREIVKELRFGWRGGRFLILFASFLFFAVLTPLMLKVVLPLILVGQLGSRAPQDLVEMMRMTQIGCIQNYLGDVVEIGAIIISFALCGLIAEEIRSRALILPLCAGKRFHHIVAAKFAVFGSALFLTAILALFVDYAYAGILFSFEVEWPAILGAGALQGGYFVFLVACLLFWGALTRRPIPTGFLSLATVLGLHLVGGLFQIHHWLPSGLLAAAHQRIEAPVSIPFRAILVTASLSAVLLLTAIRTLRGIDWNGRGA